MTAELATLAVRKRLTVAAPVETAFRVFTEEIGTWWPSGTHSIHGDDVETVVLEPREGGRLYERTAEGREAHWAYVRAFDPPHRIVLEWRVNPEAIAATEIEITFTPEGDGTRVELEHRGWDRLGEGGRASAESYETGWDAVLAPYAARF